MAFDFKKEYKEFYMPKNKPQIVTIPKANYIAVRGKGNPNEEGGEYKTAIGVLRVNNQKTERCFFRAKKYIPAVNYCKTVYNS